MEKSTESKSNTPTADGGKQTPLEPTQRKTGQGTSQDTRPATEPEAPGAKNADTPGDPNQGTEAR